MTGRRIAVIGGGISGLTAAYILARTDEVTVFEAGDRLGGHADTHLVPEPGGRPVPVDTGFIVYNERTYPLLNRLFRELGVMTQASEMSMSVSCSGCGVQYAGKRGLAGLGAGLRRGGPRYLRMLAEVPRFHRAARRVLASGESGELSLADFLRARGFSAYFTTHFAAPLVGAVWSCPPD
ncbi:MAG: FAD-dependent oxidoreductase, partial [Trebonia sp.]